MALVKLRIAKFFLRLLDLLLAPYFWIKSSGGGSADLPKNDDPILKISAVKLAEKIRKKELSSEKVVCAYINRIKEVNPILNAVVEDRFAVALNEAKAVDKMLQENNANPEELKKTKPLLGVPVTIKESCGLKGSSFAVGSLTRAGVKASVDGESVARLKASGAIPLAVTNTPELCLCFETNNLVTGTTRNPYNLSHSAGGSSGGEGALLGAGASIMGLGSDLMGSIRIPAAFNGVFGHKPSGGLGPLKGHYPDSNNQAFANSFVTGPLTRYAEDLKLMFEVIIGKDAEKLKYKLDEEIPWEEIKVYYMDGVESTLMPRVDGEIRELVRQCVEHLKDNCKVSVCNYTFPELGESIEMGATWTLEHSDLPDLLQNPSDPKNSKNVYIEFIKSLFGKSEFSTQALAFYAMNKTKLFIPESEMPKYRERLQYTQRRLRLALLNYGVLLYPTFPIAAPLHGQYMPKTFAVGYTMIFNQLGFPVTHVPLGVNRKGLPIGISIVSAANNDALCLMVAQELEKRFGGWVPPNDTNKK